MAELNGATPETKRLNGSFSLNPVFRKGILVATNNRVVARSVRRHGMRLGAARFVAGETLDEAVVALRALNRKACVQIQQSLVRA